jgi:SulP family sulfate permease
MNSSTSSESSTTNQTLFQQIISNLGAGITVALISFPLSLAIAILSGVDPITGLIAGAWAGLFGAFFLGTRFIIVGVAASVVSLQAGFLLTHQDVIGDNVIAYVSLLTIVSGLFLLFIRLFNLQNFIKYVPSSIVTGFASGVGLIITLSQTKEVFGFDVLSGAMVSEFILLNLIVFVVSLGLMLGSEKLLPKVPSAIVVSVLGVALGYAAANQAWDLTLLSERFGDLSPALFQFSDYTTITFSMVLVSDLFVVGALIAIVVVLESLITSRFISTETKTASHPKRDIFGVGVINILVGLLGGMPVLSLISRSSANIQMKATANVAAVIYALVMAMMILVLTPVIGYYPFAVIAAILVRVALPLVKLPDYQNLWKTDRGSFVVAVLVALLVVFTNASLAVMVGAFLSLLLIIRTLSQSEFSLQLFSDKTGKKKVFDYVGRELPSELPKAQKAVYQMEGLVTYFNAGLHADRISKLKVRSLVLDMQYLFLIDFEGSEVLEDAMSELVEAGVDVEIINLHRNVANVFVVNPAINVLMEKATLV